MGFNPYQFKAFARVVQEGSLSGAARAMGVSQSAVTQHLAKLEATVGTKLMTRGHTGIELTRAGREFYEYADRYATLEALISEKLQGYSDLGQGHLRIIANAPQPALRLIARYARRYPGVDLDFTLFDWSSAMEKLQAHQTDIAIVTDPTRRADWHRTPIESARYVLYVPETHRLATRNAVSLRELAEETLILPEAGSLTQRMVTGALRKHDLTLRRVVKTTTFPVMKEAILEGLGVGIFLENSARRDEQLRELPITELTARHETCLIIPRHKLDLRLSRSFLMLVKDG